MHKGNSRWLAVLALCAGASASAFSEEVQNPGLVTAAPGGPVVASADPEPFAVAGSLMRGDVADVGITFNKPVSRSSANRFDSYALSAGEVQGVRFATLADRYIVSVAGLEPNGVYTLSFTNLESPDGTPLPSSSVVFTNKEMSWTTIGDQELGFTADAIAVGDNGFDLISGGIQMRDDYDESTFAYESVSGDFDRRVRVAFQEDSSDEGRAGLMVREGLDSGKTRPASPEEAFARYLQVHVTPQFTAYSDNGQRVPARNEFQVVARLYPAGLGSPTFEETVLLTNVAPALTNAWVRLRRVGQTFSAFYGMNGSNWTSLGSYTFPTNDGLGAFSASAYVGPNYSPETGNIPFSSGARRAFLAQFRDYGLASGTDVPVEVRLEIVPAGTQVEIRWGGRGILETSTNLQPGGWMAIPGASDPHRTTVGAGEHRYFRVRL